MIKLENLPEVTNRALDGLKANESLKSKILKVAVQEEKVSQTEVEEQQALAPTVDDPEREATW